MKRARLTPRERIAVAQDQKGLCGCGCGEPLGSRTVGEHRFHFVALGCEEKPDALYRRECALKKTNGPRGDINTIAHIKRLAEKRTQADKREARGPRLKSNAKLQGPGFNKTLRKRFNGAVERISR